MKLTDTEFAKIQDELNALRLSNDAAKVTNNALQREVDALKNGDAPKPSGGLFGELSVAVSSFRHNDQKSDAQIKDLNSTIEGLNMQLSVLKTNLMEQFQTNQRLQNDLDDKKNSSVAVSTSNSKATIDELQTNLNTECEKNDALTEQVMLLTERLAEGERQMGAMIVSQRDLNTKNEEIEALNKENKMIIANATTHASDAIQVKTTQENGKKHIHVRKDNERNDERDVTATLKAEVEAKADRIEKLLKQTKTLTTRSVEQAKTEKALREELSTYRDASIIEATTMHGDAKTLSDVEGNNNDLKREVGELQSQLDTKTLRMSLLVEEIQSLTNELTQHKTSTQAARQIEEKYAEAQSEIIRLQMQLETANERTSNVAGEIETLKSKGSECEGEIIPPEINLRAQKESSDGLESNHKDTQGCVKEIAGKTERLEFEVSEQSGAFERYDDKYLVAGNIDSTCSGEPQIIEKLQKALEEKSADVERWQSEVNLKADAVSALETQLEIVQLSLQQRVRDVEEQATMNLLDKEKVVAELAQEKANHTKSKVQHEKAKADLAEAQKKQVNTEKELAELNVVHSTLVKSKLELTEVAEKHRVLVDELVREKQVQENRYIEKIKEMKASSEDNLAREKDQFTNRLEDMSQSRMELSADLVDIQNHNRVLISERDSLKQRLSTLEENEVLVTAILDKKQEQVQKLEAQIACDKGTYESEIETLKKGLEHAQKELAKMTDEKSSSRLAMEESQQAQRLIEKKGVGLMKDLKREVRQQKSIIHKLELEIAELRGAVASPFDRSSRDSGESLSAYDYSLLSSNNKSRNSSTYRAESPALQMNTDEMMEEGSISYLSMETRSSEKEVGSHVVDEDMFGGVVELQEMQRHVAKLVSRVATLQCAADVSHERVQYLEDANRSLMKDLNDKAQLIKSYVMDSNAGKQVNRSYHSKLSDNSNRSDSGASEGKPSTTYRGQAQDARDRFSAMMGRLAGSSPADNEMLKRIQAMLEESLTKNVQLQMSMELMSQENQELRSKLA
eukprot:CFRG5336T1